MILLTGRLVWGVITLFKAMCRRLTMFVVQRLKSIDTWLAGTVSVDTKNYDKTLRYLSQAILSSRVD